MKRYAVFAVFVIFALLLASCGTPTATPQPQPTQPVETSPTTPAVTVDVEALYDVTWALAAYGDPASPTVVPPGLEISAVFDREGSLAGGGGCNRYTTGFQAASDGSMTIQPEIASTMMMCEQAQMDAEAAYLKALPAVKSFSFTPDGNLTLVYALDELTSGTLVFKKGAVSLTGTQWVLLSYGSPASPTVADQSTPVTALFTKGETEGEGSVSGSASCNGYNASYTIEGEQITFGPAASTAMFCERGMEQETAFLQALEKAESFSIAGQTLSIKYDGGQGVLTFSSASLPFAQTLWRLASMDGAALPAEVEITALFTPGEEAGSGQVSGVAACNNYFGGYTQDTSVEPATLTISQTGSTMMMCDEALMAVESQYLTSLQQAQSYQILGATLTITTQPGGTLLYVAERTPLSASLWQLVSLGDVQNPLSPVEGANFTAQFTRRTGAPVGVLSGTTGCNQYAAAFSASVTEMKINTPGSTPNQSCAPGLSDQEQLYFLALNDVSSFSIQGSTLVMPYDDGKQALVFQAGALATAPLEPLSSLNDTQWYLWSLNTQQPVPGSTIDAYFAVNPDSTGGRIDGSAGCNTYIADFGLDLGVQTTLTSGENCANPPGVMAAETTYMNALASGYGFWLTGDQLILNSGAGALTYRTTPPPAANDQAHLLVNRNWFLISYNDTFSSAGAQEPFTLFNSNGTLNGFGGCNNFNASWSSSPGSPANSLQISALSSTKVACTDNALAAQEAAMFDVLTNAQTFQVVGSTLQIVGSSGNLAYSLSPRSRPEEVAAPNAVILAPSQASVNSTVTFDGRSSTSGAAITCYRWDFGDGGRGTGPVVQHVYTTAGSYRVQMTIDDELGRQSSTSWTIQIVAQPVPTAQPTLAPTVAPTVAPTAAPTTAPTGAPTQPPAPTAAPTEQPTQPPAPTEAPTEAPT